MKTAPFFFETKRLWIRPFREEDCAAEVTFLNDKTVNEPLISIPYPFTYADAMEFFRKMQKTYQSGRPEFFVLADKMTDEMIGAIGLHAEHTLARRAYIGEIGYWVGKPYWGQGYMREALPTVISFAFDQLEMKAIVATTNTDNQRSQNVLKDMGFAYLGDFTPLTESPHGTPLVTSWELMPPTPFYEEETT
ncbi:MAG: GNAT family N-acetyltransferase [Alphaproteobacteria bacterium]|nr:GNAT family N-acetyltransferase [Alphaproteobacteria bacterium]